jgi:hypothetical protein
MKDFRVKTVAAHKVSYDLNVWPETTMRHETDLFPIVDLDASVAEFDRVLRETPIPSGVQRLMKKCSLNYQPIVPFGRFFLASGICSSMEIEIAAVGGEDEVSLILFEPYLLTQVSVGDRFAITRVDWRKRDLPTEAAWFVKGNDLPAGFVWGEQWCRRGL